MTFEGALIREQGVEFAVIVVKKSVLDNRTLADDAIRTFQPVFAGVPIVLMAQDHQGTPRYYGRDDIAKFMANVPLSSVPWKKYTIAG